MSRSRLYERARKRTFPNGKEPQVSRIVNRAQTPVVENPPGQAPEGDQLQRDEDSRARRKTPRRPHRSGDEGSVAAGDAYRAPTRAQGWYSIRNAADVATIKIYNDIGGDPNGLTAQAFEQELSNLKASRIDLRLNSRGGDVFDGIAIHGALARHPAYVHVTVDGVAASIASVIAMAGDRITMARGSMLMMHEGFTAMVGNAEVMTKTAKLLNTTSDQIAGFYAARAGGSVAEWRMRMKAETWYSAEEAVAAGLADDVTPAATAVRNRMDLSVFNYAGRQAAPAPDLTRAPALSASVKPVAPKPAAPQDSWADLTGPLIAQSNQDSVLATLLEGK